MSEDKKQIVVSEVLDMLKDGKTRKDIGEHYGLSKADTKRLFLHSQLKGKKTIVKKELPFEVVDDVSENSSQIPEPPLINDNVEFQDNSEEE